MVAALLLHGGLIYSVTRLVHAEDQDAVGAPAIEIGLEMTAPKAEETNLPPGPVAEDAAASAASMEQTTKTEQKDLPQEKPDESIDAERVVAPEPPKTPKDATPSPSQTRAEHAADSVASEAAAPPKIDGAKEADKSTAPAQGVGAAAQLVRAAWQKQLVAHLNRFKRYPHASSAAGTTVALVFSLDRLGHVVTATVQKSSGDAAFDQAALDMMKRADPVPAPPPLVADETLTFSIPVIFGGKR